MTTSKPTFGTAYAKRLMVLVGAPPAGAVPAAATVSLAPPPAHAVRTRVAVTAMAARAREGRRMSAPWGIASGSAVSLSVAWEFRIARRYRSNNAGLCLKGWASAGGQAQPGSGRREGSGPRRAQPEVEQGHGAGLVVGLVAVAALPGLDGRRA